MNDLLNKHQLHFPARHDPSTTLQHFLDQILNKSDPKHHLPTIVRITSLNNYGRSMKSLLTKMSPLLLINTDQIDSILAEYHDVTESRNHSHRYRFTFNQSRISSKASNKFRNMKKLSRSLASLSGSSTTDLPRDDDEEDFIEGDDEFTAYQRNLVKNLNEKLLSSTSSISLCRIPVRCRSYFELLNESDNAIQPCQKLADLMIIEYDDNDNQKSIERWPHAFLLRTSCPAYTKKYGHESSHPIVGAQETRNDDQSSATSNDSCYGSSADLDLQKNTILLNDEPTILQAGQILTILSDCQGLRTRTPDKISSEQYSPNVSTNAEVHGSPSPFPWSKGRSFFSMFRKPRPSQILDLSTHDSPVYPATPGKPETYLKCRTEQGDFVYFSLQQSGLFSPLNGQTHRLKLDTKCNDLNLSGLFQLKDLLTNFRFPISVRCLDSHVFFDNIYSPAVIHRTDSITTIPTKFRLRMQYHEHVVFACPLVLTSSKSQKSSTSLTIIPISINADILIQPCLNMEEIWKSDAFIRLVNSCHQTIDQYQTAISLIHFPLQLNNRITRKKQSLHKKRSQSESQLGFVDDESKTTLRYSDENLNVSRFASRGSPLCQKSISPNQAILGTNKPRIASAELARVQHRSGRMAYYTKQNECRRSWMNYSDSEDERYRDVDKIYDFIRSGHVTSDVKKIQEKELATHRAFAIDIPSSGSPNMHSDRYWNSLGRSPGKMITHRFLPDHRCSTFEQQTLDFYSCKTDESDDEAETTKRSVDINEPIRQTTTPTMIVNEEKTALKPVTKMRQYSKH